MGCPSVINFEEIAATATADLQMQTMLGSEDPVEAGAQKEEA